MDTDQVEVRLREIARWASPSVFEMVQDLIRDLQAQVERLQAAPGGVPVDVTGLKMSPVDRSSATSVLPIAPSRSLKAKVNDERFLQDDEPLANAYNPNWDWNK